MTGVVRGAAIVATRLRAFEQLLRHEENALLVPYGDADGLAASLIRLIEDESLREALGGRLRQAPIPRWDDIARRTCECYRTVAAQPEHLTEVLSE